MADDTKAGSLEAPAIPAPRGANAIEQAMVKALEDVRVESEEIWGRESLSIEEKMELIEYINDPEVIKKRLLDARAGAAGSLAEFERTSLAKANEWISGKPSEDA
jgi:hypothetical protein